MFDFLDMARNLLLSNQVNDKRSQFEKVFAAIGELQAVHSKSQLDLNNIESIFTTLELGSIIQRIPGMPASDIPVIISSLKELIVKTLEVTITFPCRGPYVEGPEPYDQFAKLIRHLYEKAAPSQSASVISFNYDVAADMAMYRAGLGPDYVIDSPPASHYSVPLLKLHGSLNWATEVGSQAIRPLHLQHYFQKYTHNRFGDGKATQIHIGSNLVEYFQLCMSTEVRGEPVIVPPLWNKADYHLALTEVWASAAKHLSEAESIFIIGYSLPETDSFFRNLYALGSVGKTPLRRIMVFNPDTSGDVDKRFQGLLGPGAKARYEYFPETFDEAIRRMYTLFPGGK